MALLKSPGPPERTAPTNSSEAASARDYLTLCPEQIQPAPMRSTSSSTSRSVGSPRTPPELRSRSPLSARRRVRAGRTRLHPRPSRPLPVFSADLRALRLAGRGQLADHRPRCQSCRHDRSRAARQRLSPSTLQPRDRSRATLPGRDRRARRRAAADREGVRAARRRPAPHRARAPEPDRPQGSHLQSPTRLRRLHGTPLRRLHQTSPPTRVAAVGPTPFGEFGMKIMLALARMERRRMSKHGGAQRPGVVLCGLSSG